MPNIHFSRPGTVTLYRDFFENNQSFFKKIFCSTYFQKLQRAVESYMQDMIKLLWARNWSVHSFVSLIRKIRLFSSSFKRFNKNSPGKTVSWQTCPNKLLSRKSTAHSKKNFPEKFPKPNISLDYQCRTLCPDNFSLENYPHKIVTCVMSTQFIVFLLHEILIQKKIYIIFRINARITL